MITAYQLTKHFGAIRAVDGVDFHVPRGQVVGFLGPNGAGKTTTIRMIAGYIPPTAGSVRVDGLDVARDGREVRRRIGYLPESAPLYPEMRVDEFLTFRSRLFSIPRRDRRAAIDLAVRRCRLDDVRRRPIGQLSKGYRQRVGLAAAMLHQPPVLILDEPTVGLDPAQIREFRLLLRELVAPGADGGGQTILLSTHILPEVELTCDRIIMIAAGRIMAEGALDELRAAAAATDGQYVLETDARHASGALRKLARVEAVDAIAMGNGWHRVRVSASAGSPDLREAIARSMREQGAVVRELRREGGSLERLFMQVVGGEPPETGLVKASGEETTRTVTLRHAAAAPAPEESRIA
jgi:ABC-2 type transport system ATP-binding protein